MTDDRLTGMAFGLVGGLLVTPVAKVVARKVGAVSHPNPIVPQHQTIVPYFGGLAIAGAWALASASLGLLGRAAPLHSGGIDGVLVPAALFLTLGLYDDLHPLTPSSKLLAQTTLAGLATALGTVVHATGVATIDMPLSVVTIVVLVNAFNLTDVCDGLLSGVAATSLLGLSLLAPDTAIALLVLCGATLGFLPYNAPPASIFLGDAGSLLLGFAAAVGLAAASRAGSPWPAVPGALLITGVPLFETVFITSVRVARGKPWWKGSPDHFAIRLQAAGLSRESTDRVAYAAAAALGFAGVAFTRGHRGEQALVAATTVTGAALASRLLLRWEVPARAAFVRPPDRVSPR